MRAPLSGDAMRQRLVWSMSCGMCRQIIPWPPVTVEYLSPGGYFSTPFIQHSRQLLFPPLLRDNTPKPIPMALPDDNDSDSDSMYCPSTQTTQDLDVHSDSDLNIDSDSGHDYSGSEMSYTQTIEPPNAHTFNTPANRSGTVMIGRSGSLMIVDPDPYDGQCWNHHQARLSVLDHSILPPTPTFRP